MYSLEGKNFFENIRRSVKISHFVASIIPLALLAYFSVKYVYPYVSEGDSTRIPLNIIIILVLAVSTSVLGLILTTRATNSSIKSAQELNLKLNSLFKITKHFRETIYLDILLENIMNSAMDLNVAESGSLLLYDEDDALKFKVNKGKNSEKMNNRNLNLGTGIAGWVAENGKPALVNDVSKDSRYSFEFDNATEFNTRSVNCVPLIYANNAIGVIELRNKKTGLFTKQDQAILQSLADQASISIMQNRTHEKQQSDFIQITEILVNAQDYMQNKKGHARRVAGYANIIGKQLKFSESDLKKLYYACLLHDVGMLRLDIKDQSQKDKIKKHPKFGHDLIKPISLWSDLADIILHHHERFDGSGYPLSKKGNEIPLEARILTVADTFDILTSDYSYKEPINHDIALQEIEDKSGTQFDPKIVQALKYSIEEASTISL